MTLSMASIHSRVSTGSTSWAWATETPRLAERGASLTHACQTYKPRGCMEVGIFGPSRKYAPAQCGIAETPVRLNQGFSSFQVGEICPDFSGMDLAQVNGNPPPGCSRAGY